VGSLEMASVKSACLLSSMLLYSALALPAYGQNPGTPQQAQNLPAISAPVGITGGANQSEMDDVTTKINRMLKTFKPLELPPEPTTDHELNRSLNLSPLRQSDLIPLASMRPVRLEASYTEPLSLHDALNYCVTHNLPIKISRESWNYQRYQFWGEVADFLPNYSLGWTLTHSNINTDTNSIARVFQTTVRFPVFLGGNVVYTALAQYYRVKGWHQALYTTVNDSLLDVYIKYTNLVLNNALLQIRAKSLEVSQAQLQLNNALYRSGNGTQFAIMQSRTQLATDRQALLQQQVVVRQSALALSYALNMPMSVNLIPSDDLVRESSIVDERIPINDLLQLALVHRPELRQYELYRLSAARNVQVAASPLYPQVSFFTTYTHSSTSTFPPANTNNLNGVASAAVTPFLNPGTATNVALNQVASFSPTGNNVANTGANTGATTVVAGSGGNPIATTQSGSLVTSGAVAPSLANSTTTSTTAPGTANVNGSNTAGAGVFNGLFNTFQAGFTINWSLPNLGLGSVANILSARALSRQALLQANQELILVTEQVRAAYLNAVTAREQIDTAAYGVASSGEALRLGTLRLRAGMGTNLELITAQRDYINALTAQAQAIIASDQAQAQLLHDTGLITVNTILGGYRRGQIVPVPKDKL
jgi:outer membrane protein TolC